MTDIILVGCGGCMRELAWQILESNKICMEWNIVGYVDEDIPGKNEGVIVSGKKIPFLGDDNFLLASKEDVNVVVSVGNPSFRKRLVMKYEENEHILFPNLILKNAKVCEDIQIGKGCIISMGATISTNVSMGDFAFINMEGMVCHDGRLGNFVSINPSAKLAGTVSVGDETEIGMSATIIQGIQVGSHVTIGAGSVIIRDTQDSCTIVGIPGRKVRG